MLEAAIMFAPFSAPLPAIMERELEGPPIEMSPVLKCASPVFTLICPEAGDSAVDML
jgi:hypothetical protein